LLIRFLAHPVSDLNECATSNGGCHATFATWYCSLFSSTFWYLPSSFLVLSFAAQIHRVLEAVLVSPVILVMVLLALKSTNALQILARMVVLARI
jgi:hypothetical protein